MTDHFTADDAALYALGALDERRRAAVDRHAAQCAACLRLLGAAEDDVAALAAADIAHVPPAPPMRVPPAHVRQRAAWPAWAALAAVLAVALVPTGYFWQQSRTMHAAIATRAEVMSRLAEGGVRTVQFSPLPAGANARVMYAADGSWYVVLVRGAASALDVVWMHRGKQTLLGTAHPDGDVAMLYLPKSHRMDQLALLEGRRVVAEAQLAY